MLASSSIAHLLDITTIDCEYLYPKFAAAYLIQDHGRAIFIDNNTAHSVPLLLSALDRAGLKPADVDYLIITHVHLDHAGGSSALMKICTNAKLLGHPRAVPHVIDPTKLVSSAEHVYGKEEFQKLYGKIEPIAADRVRAVADEEILEWGEKKFRFFFTRGHANHHICIQLSSSKSSIHSKSAVFTGDSFGLAYPILQNAGLFIFPSTSPTDFDGPEAKKSIQKILNSGAEEVFLTHFGGVRELENAAQQLMLHLEFSEKLLEEALHSKLPDEKLSKFCEDRLKAHMNTALGKNGMALSGEIELLLRLDIELNAQGLAHVAKKRRHA